MKRLLIVLGILAGMVGMHDSNRGYERRSYIVRDSNGYPRYIVRDKTIYDTRGYPRYHIKGDDIYDNKGYKRYEIEKRD